MSAIAEVQRTATPTCIDLVQQHTSDLWLAAQWLTDSGAEAEDLTRQTVVTGAREFGRMGPAADMRLWLLGIMLDLDRRRRQEAGSWMVAGLGSACRAGERYAGESGGEVDMAADSAAGLGDLERAVRRLPDSLRIPILLADVLSLSYRQVGRLLGLPGGAVRSRISQGRSRLLAFLGDAPRARTSPPAAYSCSPDAGEAMALQA